MQRRMVAGSATYAATSPPASGTGLAKTTNSRWQPFHSHIPLRCCCTAARTTPPQMVAVGCEAGFQHVPMGKCAACHIAWLLRDAKEPSCSGESLPTAAAHSAQCTTPTTTTIPAVGQGRSKMQPSASAANKPPNACQHGQQLTSLPCQDTCPERELLPSREGHSVLEPPLHLQARWGWQGAGSTACATAELPLPSAPAEGELREEPQERGPARFGANGSQHTLRLSAQRTPSPACLASCLPEGSH